LFDKRRIRSEISGTVYGTSFTSFSGKNYRFYHSDCNHDLFETNVQVDQFGNRVSNCQVKGSFLAFLISLLNH